jgi:hypothetical protein
VPDCRRTQPSIRGRASGRRGSGHCAMNTLERYNIVSGPAGILRLPPVTGAAINAGRTSGSLEDPSEWRGSSTTRRMGWTTRIPIPYTSCQSALGRLGVLQDDSKDAPIEKALPSSQRLLRSDIPHSYNRWFARLPRPTTRSTGSSRSEGKLLCTRDLEYARGRFLHREHS